MTGKFLGVSAARYFQNWWIKLVLLLVLSLCFKLWVLHRVEVINPDAVQYLKAAQHHLSGDLQGALKHYRMPFYPMLIAQVRQFLVPDLVLAGQLLSVFFLTGLMVPFCLLVRDAWGDAAAWLGGALLACSPYFNRHAPDVVRDPALLFFLVWGMWATWRVMKTGGWSWALLASLMATLSALCRIEGALLFLAFPAACLVGGRSLSMSRRIGLATILIVAGPLCLSPMAVWVAVRTGELPGSRFPELLTLKEHLLLIGEKYRLYYDMLKNVEQGLPGGGPEHNFFEVARHYIPVIYLVGLAESFIRVVSPAVFLASLLVLKSLRSVKSELRWALGCVFACYLCLAILMRFQDAWHSDRFILVPATVWSLGAGQGALLLWRWHRERWRSVWKRRLATIVIVLLLLTPAFKTLTYEAGRERNIVKAGEWIARHSKAGTTVLTNDARIAFYAETAFAPFEVGRGDIDNLIRKNQASLVAVRGTKSELSRFLGSRTFKEIEIFPGKKKTVLILETGRF